MRSLSLLLAGTLAGLLVVSTSLVNAQNLPEDPEDVMAEATDVADGAADGAVTTATDAAGEAADEGDALLQPALDEAPAVDPAATTTTMDTPPSDLMTEQAEAEANVADESDAPAVVTPASDCPDYRELPGCKYYFLGLMYRHTWTPGFILNLFTEDATPANNLSFGLSFTYRKDGLSVVTDLYWQRFAVNGPFRGLDDPVEETEIIDSSLSAIMASVTFLWSSRFSDIFAIEYGLGLGLGAVLGNLVRTEAHPSGDGYAPCIEPGNPDGRFCDGPSVADGASGGHYGVNARKWLDGGSVPNIWLRLAPTLGVRLKPVSWLQLRAAGGFDIFSGFFGEARIEFGF